MLSVEVPKNKSNGRNNGYALVEMKTEQEAQAVINNFNETLFKDSKIKISIAQE